MDTEFEGFSKELQTFFKNLSSNNSKEWFDENRDQYDRYVLEPSRLFVVAIGKKLKSIVPDLQAIPIPNKSLFRINRDTRFSKDKSPYKTHMGIYLWEGARPKRMECSGFYVHYENGEIFLGSGLHIFPKDILKNFRSVVAHKSKAIELLDIIKKVKSHPEISVGGDRYKRIPAGYEVTPENGQLLTYKGLFASIEPAMPEAFYSREFIDFCFERYRIMSPIHRFIADNLY